MKAKYHYFVSCAIGQAIIFDHTKTVGYWQHREPRGWNNKRVKSGLDFDYFDKISSHQKKVTRQEFLRFLREKRRRD